MADTPFINSLSDDNKATVAKRAAKVRPSFTDAGAAEAASSAAAVTGVAPSVQISADTEAFLILLSPPVKAGLVSWIDAILALQNDPDLAALYQEVVEARFDTLVQADSDVGVQVRAFEAQLALSKPPIFIANVGSLLATLNRGFAMLYTPEAEIIHDRIMDQLVLNDYQNKGTGSDQRKQELESWKSILQRYA